MKKVGFVLAIALSLGAIIWNPINQVYAQNLVRAANVVGRITELVGPGEVLHYFTTVYERVDPTFMEPLDPYHLPLLPLYSSGKVIEHWVAPQFFKEIHSFNADRSIVLYEFVRTETTLLSYDGLTGIVSQLPLANISNPNSDPQSTAQDNSWIEGLHKSQWGTMAWIVKFESILVPPSDSDLDHQGHPAQQSPFSADLQFDKVQQAWEIDQKTGFVISKAIQALTPSGPVTLYSETNSAPEIVSIASLPLGWDELALPTGELLQPPSLDENPGLVHEDNRPPEEIVQQVDFAVYLPNQAALKGFAMKFDRTATYYRPDRTYQPPAHAFDIYQSAANGLGIQAIYFSSTPTDPIHPHAWSLIEAPASKIVPLLQKSFPMWKASKSSMLFVEGSDREAWIVSGGLLREFGNNPLVGLMFEIDDTFIYLEGQNVNENDLLQVAQSLQKVNSAN